MFFALCHRDYGCNHLFWALKVFLPDYFEDVEESLFVMDAEWRMASSSEYGDAVNDGSIRQIKLMDIVRGLSASGFHYHPKICVFKDIPWPGPWRAERITSCSVWRRRPVLMNR